MKWTREKPGHYASGIWTIKGKGIKWQLLRNNKLALKGSGKKELQLYAEQQGKAKELDEEFVEQRAAKQPAAPKAKDLDSVLASLRLEIDHLSLRIDALSASNKGLAEAIMLLASHVKKLKK
jgi:hypothetical protein